MSTIRKWSPCCWSDFVKPLSHSTCLQILSSFLSSDVSYPCSCLMNIVQSSLKCRKCLRIDVKPILFPTNTFHYTELNQVVWDSEEILHVSVTLPSYFHERYWQCWIMICQYSTSELPRNSVLGYCSQCGAYKLHGQVWYLLLYCLKLDIWNRILIKQFFVCLWPIKFKHWPLDEYWNVFKTKMRICWPPGVISHTYCENTLIRLRRPKSVHLFVLQCLTVGWTSVLESRLSINGLMETIVDKAPTEHVFFNGSMIQKNISNCSPAELRTAALKVIFFDKIKRDVATSPPTSTPYTTNPRACGGVRSGHAFILYSTLHNTPTCALYGPSSKKSIKMFSSAVGMFFCFTTFHKAVHVMYFMNIITFWWSKVVIMKNFNAVKAAGNIQPQHFFCDFSTWLHQTQTNQHRRTDWSSRH